MRVVCSRQLKVMSLSWGSELWDKFDECWKLTRSENIFKYFRRQFTIIFFLFIDSLNLSDSTEKLDSELKRFFKLRSDIEKDYVGKLHKLQKNFTPRGNKSDEEDSCLHVFR